MQIYNNQLIIDIHGMTENEAKTFLISKLNNIAPQIEQLVIIHGYRGGNILANMVRKKLKHPKIYRKILTLNSGETILILKK